ncbi:sigma-70 family RNA polymerase sigma factor [Priestia aryabhattai]|uniref:Sigma-70 family RNA polymerase sigma factor n=1 Tax=Priestia aryabhattai TaxID=412384 RepID=A0ABD7X3I1_PRIAR|nr:sigma-70 family RNA polymerase sigma factor [Priestia aryabhattai]WEA47274.1 sigma-70 family RNA polymerase sigma factor [Priestia aryabhattai]
MKDLIFEYEHDLAALRKLDRKLKTEQDLINDKRLKEKHTVSDLERLIVIESTRSMYSSMIGEMEDDITHMRTGKRPGARRGVEKRYGNEKVYAVDPVRFLHIPDDEKEIRSEEELTMLEDQVEDLLWFLTKTERDIYMLCYGQYFSEQEIAEISGKSKGSVSQLLHRARKKVEKNIKKDDFYP